MLSEAAIFCMFLFVPVGEMPKSEYTSMHSREQKLCQKSDVIFAITRRRSKAGKSQPLLN